MRRSLERCSTAFGMLKYSCSKKELSCIIGNLFIELLPPCGDCNEGEFIIQGITYTGEKAKLVILNDGCFLFSGSPESLAKIRQSRCIHNG